MRPEAIPRGALHLNAIRLEGKLENDHFFDLADQMGILVMAGWCCCDQWENWPTWDKENERIAGDSLRDQIRRLERHPSVFTWLYGSDFAPPPRIENLYLQILKQVELAKPFHLIGRSQDDYGRPQRREDDRPLRIRCAIVLVCGYDSRWRVRFQH